MIANVITNLEIALTALNPELLPAPILQNGLTLFISTLIFTTPLFMLSNNRKKDQLLTMLTLDLQYVNELLQNVTTRTHPQLARTLKWTIFLPFFDAPFAIVFSTVVAFHGVTHYFKADAAGEGVAEFLVHPARPDSIQVVAAWVVRCR